jgi:hypothetical protein
MKTTLIFQISVLVSTFCSGHSAARAQTRTSENVLLPSPDFAPTGGGHAVLIDPFNSTPAPGLLLGIDSLGSGSATILRLTPNDSASTSFSVSDLDHELTDVTRLANNPGDALYAVGYAPLDPTAKNITYVWKVRKSSSLALGNLGTWTDDDTFLLARNASAYAWGVTTDGVGNVFVSGAASDSHTPHWIIRRKRSGDTFRTVFDAKGTDLNMVPSLCFFPGNVKNPKSAVIAASELNSKWTVIRSQSQGASGTWQQVDSWTAGGASTAYDLTCDPVSGTIYAVGCQGLNGSGAIPPSDWVIRSSVDGGDNWNLLLNIGGRSSWARTAVVDAAGNVSVSGVINQGGTPLWKVIRCTNPQDPASWLASFSAADTVAFGPATYSKGKELAVDSYGNVFASGEVTDWAENSSTIYSGLHVGLLRLAP